MHIRAWQVSRVALLAACLAGQALARELTGQQQVGTRTVSGDYEEEITVPKRNLHWHLTALPPPSPTPARKPTTTQNPSPPFKSPPPTRPSPAPPTRSPQATNPTRPPPQQPPKSLPSTPPPKSIIMSTPPRSSPSTETPPKRQTPPPKAPSPARPPPKSIANKPPPQRPPTTPPQNKPPPPQAANRPPSPKPPLTNPPTLKPPSPKPPALKPPTRKPPSVKPPTRKPPSVKPPTLKPPSPKPPALKPPSPKPPTLKSPSPKPPTLNPPSPKPPVLKPPSPKPTPKLSPPKPPSPKPPSAKSPTATKPPPPKKASPPPPSNSNDPVAKYGLTNCAVLAQGRYNVWWKVANGVLTVGQELASQGGAWAGMGFNKDASAGAIMPGTDAVVSGHDGTLCFALDFALEGDGGYGRAAVPDPKNDVTMLNCAKGANGFFITWQRALKTGDSSDVAWPATKAYLTWANGMAFPGGSATQPFLFPHGLGPSDHSPATFTITLGAAVGTAACTRIT